MKDGSQACGGLVSEKWPEGGVFQWACIGEVDHFLFNSMSDMTGCFSRRVSEAPRGVSLFDQNSSLENAVVDEASFESSTASNSSRALAFD